MGERIKKGATWLAVAGSVVIALLSYLESRSVAKAAEANAQINTKIGTTQGAVYERLSTQIQRTAKDINACHARVDKVFDALLKLSNRRRSRRDRRMAYLPEVVKQRHIVRPLPAELPKKKGDVAADDPLAGALK